MSTNDLKPAATPAAPEPRPIASGWLGAQSQFEHEEKSRLGGALSTSFLVHIGLFVLLFLAYKGAEQIIDAQPEPLVFTEVFVPKAGPGGGGGGSPAPAPKKQMEIPKTAPAVTVPTPVVAPVEPPPIPVLTAPIQTTTSSVIQASGSNMISLAQYGGGGRGGGIGSGTGSGVGPGTGGGFGGGAFQPGNGVSHPTVLHEEKPKYTAEAMRAKVQGEIELEIVIKEDGTVGEVRVVKSFTNAYGLDQAAMDAARKWRFVPGKKGGVPVPTRVPLVLTFRLY